MHVILLLVLGTAWGLQFTLLKIAADADLGELGILSVSLTLLALGFLLAMAWSRTWFRPTARHIRFFFVSGLFGFVLPLGGVILAAEHLSAGLIVFYESLTPLFTVVIALALRTETLTAERIAAVTLGMLGVVLVLWPELIVPDNSRLHGLVIAFIIPLAYAIDGIYVAARWPQNINAFQVVTGEAVAGAALLLPFYIWSGDFIAFSGSWGTGESAIVAFVLVSFVEVYLYFYLLRTTGAVFVSVASFIALFAGIFWGMSLLGEQHPPSVWLAVALVSGALYLVSVRSPNAARTVA